jgi:cation transport protein ChaC
VTKLDAYIPPAAAAKPLSPMELLASLRSALTPWTPGTPFWIFAYGSLMWNPSFTFDVRHVATIRGYHRSFRVWSRINRGTPD